MTLKTKRLYMVPQTAEMLEELISKQTDEHLKAAYTEMLNGVKSHPGKEKWYTNWIICLNGSGLIIGGVCFKGEPNDNHEVEIGYGINQEYQNQGFATEALRAMTNWAFSQPSCYYVQALTETGSESSKKVLENNKFKFIRECNEGLLYELEKPASALMSIYMCIGLSIGLSFGLMFENQAVGMCIGISVGLLIGSLLDAQDRKNRKRVNKNSNDNSETL